MSCMSRVEARRPNQNRTSAYQHIQQAFKRGTLPCSRQKEGLGVTMNAKTKKEQIELAWEQHEDEKSMDLRMSNCYWEDLIMTTLLNEEIEWLYSIGKCSMSGQMFSNDFYKKPEETEKDLNLPVASFQP